MSINIAHKLLQDIGAASQQIIQPYQGEMIRLIAREYINLHSDNEMLRRALKLLENRGELAKHAMQGFCATVTKDDAVMPRSELVKAIAEISVKCADALIHELTKGDQK